MTKRVKGRNQMNTDMHEGKETAAPAAAMHGRLNPLGI